MSRPRDAWRLLPLLLLLGCPDGGGNGGGNGGGAATGAEPVVCAADAALAAAVDFAAAFGGETFSQPVKLVQHPMDDDRFYVVEQAGSVETLLASNPAARSLAVDVTASVGLIAGGERGLLGMAFDPDFDVNGEVFLSYTEGTSASFDSVVGRFVSPDAGQSFVPAAADPAVIAIDQPFANHNGGDIAFGPDGYLYYALGDGGGAGDPAENGQDVTTLLGSILRLDVSTTPPGIPPDNPFVGSAGADAIFAFGLRNPWRISFDQLTGELWAADVGQNSEEELGRISAGGNHGWDCYEGFSPFELDANCVAGAIAPEVVHLQPDFQSITGGFVYRGAALPELQGAYVYGDFITGEVCAYFFEESPARVLSLDPPASLNVSSFARDRDGELYLLDYFGATSIYKLVPGP